MSEPTALDERALARYLEADPRREAERVGLRYVETDEPGYERKPWGRGFTYRDAEGETVRSKKLRRRFEELAIPPAWAEVWICRDPRGHVQVTGRDDEGRKQYIYHPRWEERREARRSERMLAFGWLLTPIRRAVRRDLRREGLGRRRVMAAVVRLLETTAARIGYAEYAEDNDTYGLATVRKRHVEETEDGLRLVFESKADKPWELDITDESVVEVVRACLEVPGYELFKFFDEEGTKRDLTAEGVNDYLAEITGQPVHAKDFRTWAATVEAARILEGIPPSERQDDSILSAIDGAAERLRNTRAICRDNYICREVLDRFEKHPGRSDALRDQLPELRVDERAVLAFLAAVVVGDGRAPG